MKKIYIFLIVILFHQISYSQSEIEKKVPDIESSVNNLEMDKSESDIGKEIAENISVLDTLISFLKDEKNFRDENKKKNNFELFVFELYKNLADTRKLVMDNLTNTNSREYFEARLNSLEFLAKNIIRKQNGKAKISIIGDATILNGNSESQNVNGIGSLGINFLSRKRDFEITALINLIGTKDTSVLMKDTLGNYNNSVFGRSVLNPFSGANSLSSAIISSKWYVFNAVSDFPNIGVISYLGFASQNWRDTNGASDQANIFSFSAGIFWNVLSKHVNINDEFQLIPFLNFTGRLIYGDIRHNVDLRKRALLTDQLDFYGMEIGFQIKFSDFNAFVMLPALFGRSSVKGITEGQFVAGISLNTAIKVVEF